MYMGDRGRVKWGEGCTQPGAEASGGIQLFITASD